MNIIKPGFIIETPVDGIELLKGIERIGRTCYKSEDKITEDSAAKFVKGLISRGHTAMIEHNAITVRFTCDRGVSHELVRHRIASFAQESTRYCNYSNDKFGSELTMIDIQGGVALDTKMKGLPAETICFIMAEWFNAMQDAEKHYNRMIELGATPQIARGVLPNSVKTEIVMTMNLREWRHFFVLRADKPAHPQMREIVLELLKAFMQMIPVVFDDLAYLLD